jgi:hypothetical protein
VPTQESCLIALANKQYSLPLLNASVTKVWFCSSAF